MELGWRANSIWSVVGEFGVWDNELSLEVDELRSRANSPHSAFVELSSTKRKQGREAAQWAFWWK